MGQAYFKNVEDGISDPFLIEARFQIGRSIAYEVEVTLGEYNDRIVPNGGGLQGSPALIAATYAEQQFPNGCPEVNQYIPVGTTEQDLRYIKAKSLVGRVGEISLYNPISRNFNLLTDCEIIEVPLFEIRSLRGISATVSQTHKAIRNTNDFQGISLVDYIAGGEVLVNEKLDIFADQLLEMKDAGIGKAVVISLKTEFIYTCGAKRGRGCVSRNRKNLEPIF